MSLGCAGRSKRIGEGRGDGAGRAATARGDRSTGEARAIAWWMRLDSPRRAGASKMSRICGIEMDSPLASTGNAASEALVSEVE